MHLFQVGVGSGGIVVLDLIARNESIRSVTIIDPDTYAEHNVQRHIFPNSSIGRFKVELAAQWIRERRPDLSVTAIAENLMDPDQQQEIVRLAEGCDIGVCAVDNEPAKYAFDALMRLARKPWTLGEVLSGGIGGWVHRFSPVGACYGCVASHLQRTVLEEPAAPAHDYNNPSSRVAEARVPASKESITVIAGLHAVVTSELLRDVAESSAPELAKTETARTSRNFTSMLFTLKVVPGVFEEAYRTYRFKIPRLPGCLVCGASSRPLGSESGEVLDVALDQALGRLAPQ